MRLGNEKWGSIGLKRPESIPKMLLWTAAVFVVTLSAGFVVESVVPSLVGMVEGPLPSVDERYQNRFANLPGNLLVYLQWVAIAWIVGGFTEELLFRGFLISRFEQLCSGVPFAVVIAIVLQAILFGHQHFYYQGLAGALATGLIALVSGLFYILLKRNIWPLILSHGLANTLGFTLIFLGVMPPP
ncbi:MAG: CPBP family intramembrane glutamic endopeptidase [Pseudomonadota bacterium]